MIREAIDALVSKKSLTFEQAAAVMEEIMTGEATPAQFGAFVTALRLKGETVDEIAGMAKVMREKALRVDVPGLLVDTCGTGGDASGTFNISTAAALVAAAAGVKIAKHGNRAITSGCGSADILEASGVKIDLPPEGVKRCIEQVGIGFMFAPVYHPAMKYAAGPRREIGIRTVFNILGPLTNPAGAQAQVLGVPSSEIAPKMAQVLHRLGTRHAMVVHGEDGLDEISTTGPTKVWELKDGSVKEYTIKPEELGLPRVKKESLKGGSAQENAAILKEVLRGQKGPLQDVVALNAGAALMVGEKAKNLKDGISLAQRTLESGAALEKLAQLVAVSNQPI